MASSLETGWTVFGTVFGTAIVGSLDLALRQDIRLDAERHNSDTAACSTAQLTCLATPE
jgi:hypothetical protein